jgi:HMG (high mobility group) box
MNRDNVDDVYCSPQAAPASPSDQRVVARRSLPIRGLGETRENSRKGQDGKAKSTKKSSTVRKPSDVPRKPLSAYNLFFQLERENIINGQEDSNYTFENVARIAQVYYEQGKTDMPKRKHRKSHGKISFAELARTIANKWRALDIRFKALFEERAAMEKTRHHQEIVAWVNSKIHPGAKTLPPDADPIHETNERPIGMTDASAQLTRTMPSFLAQASTEPVTTQTHTFPSAQEFQSERQGRWNGQSYPVPNEGNYYEARIPDEAVLPNWRHDIDPSRASYAAMGTQSARSADRPTRFPSTGQLFRSRSAEASVSMMNRMSDGSTFQSRAAGMPNASFMPYSNQEGLQAQRFPMDRSNNPSFFPSNNFAVQQAWDSHFVPPQRFASETDNFPPFSMPWDPSNQLEIDNHQPNQMWTLGHTANERSYNQRSAAANEFAGTMDQAPAADSQLRAFLNYLDEA